MESLTAGVTAVMRRAAEVAILPRYRSLRSDQVSEKSENNIVTIADHESEAILAEGLAALLPEAAIVGEEATHADPSLMSKLGAALCWIVDPVDGTNNFAAGRPPFGILVALAQAGETIAGWIYDPLTGRCCRAERGGGAFVDDQPVRSLGTGREKPVVAVAMELVDPRRTASMRELLDPLCSLVGIPRCAAEQYPRLALGENDIAFYNRTFAWDHAAGALFLNEAGGRIARYDGSPYRVDDDKVGLLGASTPAMWDWMRELMTRL